MLRTEALDTKQIVACSHTSDTCVYLLSVYYYDTLHGYTVLVLYGMEMVYPIVPHGATLSLLVYSKIGLEEEKRKGKEKEKEKRREKGKESVL